MPPGLGEQEKELVGVTWDQGLHTPIFREGVMRPHEMLRAG